MQAKEAQSFFSACVGWLVALETRLKFGADTITRIHLMYFISRDGKTAMTARALNEFSLFLPSAVRRFNFSFRLQPGASDFRWNSLS
jgi:hypothetical protein